jgi:hypothetical protein
MGRLHDKALWHRRARRQLQCEPLCAICLAEGKIVAASIADHVEPSYRRILVTEGVRRQRLELAI